MNTSHTPKNELARARRLLRELGRDTAHPEEALHLAQAMARAFPRLRGHCQSSRARIWIDCDDVQSDFTAGYLAALNAYTGRNHVHADVVEAEFADCVASPDEDYHVWRNVIDLPGFVRGLVDLPGSREAIAELRKLGSVGVLTSPHHGPHWMHERVEWLRERGFTKRNIVMTGGKFHVAGDVFVDDNLSHAENWQDFNPFGLAIVFDQPWNRVASSELTRARDWAEVVTITRSFLADQGFVAVAP